MGEKRVSLESVFVFLLRTSAHYLPYDMGEKHVSLESSFVFLLRTSAHNAKGQSVSPGGGIPTGNKIEVYNAITIRQPIRASRVDHPYALQALRHL